MASALVVAGATPALAASVQVSGGTWSYGVGGGYVYSSYYHVSKCHGSSVQGAYFASSGNTDAGIQANASAETAWSGNKSYYRSTCE
ncbi:lactococcin 972 family bacteriocin [Streptomyces sp. NBC_00868]|uniref:lactococcin 972 family bacteriocin n=1 Tax=unclassified Streptomyces TaxID=2593676 RepID=UPI00324AED04|nr:lactococcin 972 family bacteriocin [Streptomyces sp. NBC_00868]